MTTPALPVHIPGEGEARGSLLIEQAREAWADTLRQNREARLEWMRLDEECERTLLAEQLHKRLGVQLPPARVDIRWDEGDCSARAVIDGLTFSAGHSAGGRAVLYLMRPCPACERQAYEAVAGIAELGRLLASGPLHAYCPNRQADYEIVDAAEEAWKTCAAAWEAFGTAKAYEMLLEDQRPLIKAAAVLRLIEAKVATSATAAEKVVEMDAEYMRHRIAQRDAVIATQKAFGEAKAAEFRAQRAADREGR